MRRSDLELLLEVEPGQAAADCLGRHRVCEFSSDKAISVFAIESDCGVLHLGGAQHYCGKVELARPRLGTGQHALRNPAAAIRLVEIHTPQLCPTRVAGLDTEHAHDSAVRFDHPKGVAPLR